MRPFVVNCVLSVAIIIIFAPISWASQSQRVKHGNKLYADGEYQASAEQYKLAIEKEPEHDIINFDLGTVLYKMDDYDGAINHLQKSLLTDKHPLKQKAYYNLGNSFYQKGMAIENKDIDSAIKHLEKSLSYFDSAIAMEAEDKDAQHNYEVVNKELQRLKEKKKRQQQQEKESQDQKEQPPCPLPKEEPGSGDGRSQQQKQDEPKRSEEPQGDSAESEESQKQEQGGEAQKEQEAGDNQLPQEGPLDGTNEQTSPGQSANINEKELTQQEAERLLMRYRQGEEPKNLLNFYKEQGKVSPVLKDW